ncbi:large ribosomal subunit protein mL50-like [Ptychodera flava]|uniref:large ribosomal subunit protein mL50-like n=1 Tax=Ptychodera flava TaxID=63121 RepID=UPI00396A1002
MATSLCFYSKTVQTVFSRNTRLNGSLFRLAASQLQSRDYADDISHQDRSWLKRILYGSQPASDDLDDIEAEVVEAKYMAIPGIQEKPYVIARPRVRKRAYKPPADAVEHLEAITKSHHPEIEEWRDIQLSDPLLKYKILTQCMTVFKHCPTSYQLNELKTMNDIVNFYQTEVKDSTAFDELSQQDLPRNLKINWQ